MAACRAEALICSPTDAIRKRLRATKATTLINSTSSTAITTTKTTTKAMENTHSSRKYKATTMMS